LGRIDALAAEGDGARASQALLTLAFRAWWSTVPQALRERMVARARTLPPGTPEVLILVTLALVAPEEHGPEVAGWLERIEPDELPSELLRVAAAITGVVGAFDRGVIIGDHAIARLRARGRYGMLAPALVGRAWDGVFAGAWSASLAAAQDATLVARETEQPLWAVAGLAAEGALTGLRGEVDRGLALADDAEATLPPGAAEGMRAMIESARGLALLGSGDPAAAFAHLRRVLDAREPWHTGFVARWVLADAVEAAVLAGERPAAQELVERGAALPRPSAHLTASLAYARLLLDPDAEADAALAASVELPALRARVQLVHGSRLRRRRSPDARALLRAARDTFEALDIAPGAERARSELRAAGEAVRTAAVDPAAVLTPQELQIARMAAGGLSNREIGQALYLSHRTIGSNLYRVFPKLGIASRGELRAVLAQ
jgi:DNA-binding NarL/FixJ family response regulator